MGNETPRTWFGWFGGSWAACCEGFASSFREAVRCVERELVSQKQSGPALRYEKRRVFGPRCLFGIDGRVRHFAPGSPVRPDSRHRAPPHKRLGALRSKV